MLQGANAQVCVLSFYKMLDRQTLICDICVDYQKVTKCSFYSEQDFTGL